MIYNFLKNKEEFLNHLVTQASINPEQYDSSNVCWDPYKKVVDSPVRQLMQRFLLPYIKSSYGNSILEIGCGTGWLLAKISKYVPQSVLGIEPSVKNVEIAKCLYPNIKINCLSFEDFQTDVKFDTIYSLMVLSHIKDLEKFFNKCINLMNKSGKLIIIIPNYDYFQRPRDGYITKIVYFNNQYSINIQKNFSSLSQIVRKNEIYHEAAKKAGFSILAEKFIKIDKKLVEMDKKYKNSFGLTMHNLIIYRK